MWTVDATDFFLLRGGEGGPFTAFMDSLIRAHGFVYGVGEAEILTSLRTSVRDGGVDTQVRRAMTDEPSEFLRVPTCWQYKAMSNADITEGMLRREIRKHYSAELIRQGYGYRLAVCDDMTSEKQAAWESLLTAEARQINPQAPEARVATASKLASWANAYPPMLFTFFQIDPGPVQHFEAWAPNMRRTTPTFVPLEEWRGANELIGQHFDLARDASDPIITLQGLAGVGKTRLVFEVLAKLASARNLVFYARDGDDAERVARFVENNRRTCGILVADECPVHSRAAIRSMLKGHTRRVRVICIDNSGERLAGDPELWLDQLSGAAVEEVLEKNFPRVPSDRRRAYAAESRGYIRLAAGLCESDAEIVAKGHFGPALDVVQEYYREKLPEAKQRRAVEAISLVQRVGFGEGVSEELDALCAFTGQKPEDVDEVSRTLKDAPGFIARTTRFLYVTPEIIAKVAFARAWDWWFEPDPTAALRRIPPSLLRSFQARVAQSASKEVRALTGQFFWSAVSALRPADLADAEAMERLATLVDTDPAKYFPRLALLVRTATLEELRQSRGLWGIPGSRRTLVWTAQRLAAFREYFGDAEEILRRLGLAETEERISNNATGVWKELFRIQLSGTEVPFVERVDLLGRLLSSSDGGERSLALRALDESLNLIGTHLVGPSVVGGRLVPPDWAPRTRKEFDDCLEIILGLFGRVFESGPSDVREGAWRTLAQHLRILLGHGMLPVLKVAINSHPIPEAHLPDMLESLEDFLRYECAGESGSVADDPYCQQAAEWLQKLTPCDFASRLKAIVGKDPWHFGVREEPYGPPAEITGLAEELKGDPAKLDLALPYLNSRDAVSAGLLGDALARLDHGASLDRIMTAASGSGSGALASGYAARLLMIDPSNAERLNVWLNRLENDAPVVAYYVALSSPTYSRPLERTLRLIEEEKLPVQSLQYFIAGVLLDPMSPTELSTVLGLLVQAGDSESLHIATDFVGQCVHKGRTENPVEREAMWRVLDASAPVEDRGDYWWHCALAMLAPADAERACGIAIKALFGQDHRKSDDAWSVLSQIAKSDPDAVMKHVGAAILDEKNGWRLRVRRAGVLATLPTETVQRWLDNTGLEGARAIATHLQPPSAKNGGEPRVHPTTEYVLAHWGDDEVVFGRFAASTHQMQIYSGDIAGQHLREAEAARAFLSHRIPAVRRWAEFEVARGEDEARQWSILEEEQFIS